ncbi:hypothetical protein ACEQ8H_007045 [Pleosporales sp. CAS-2024a]
MAKDRDMQSLIDVTKTTQTLVAHLSSSLAPSTAAASQAQTPAQTPTQTQTRTQSARAADVANPLDAIKASATVLQSHTTTLSLLLLTPPLTPSALMTKIGHVHSGAVKGMVAAAGYVSQPGHPGDVGNLMRTALRAQVRGVLGTWGHVLGLVLGMAEKRQGGTGNDAGPSESEKQQVLAATGVVWEACEALLQLCNDGVVGLVVTKATELRATLLDAIAELKAWSEDMADDHDDDDDDDDDDDLFDSINKLAQDDQGLKELADTSLKKLKTIGMLYQALIKRRLKTYPAASADSSSRAASSPARKLDELMALLKAIPDTVDDLAGAFYDLDEDGAQGFLHEAKAQAKRAAELVKQNWAGGEDEFTAWSATWAAALETE